MRAGQKLVFDSCGESLKITWKTPVAGIPEPRCEGGECTLVAPRVNERTEVLYDVSGTVSYTPLRAHETVLELVCRLLLETKNKPLQPFIYFSHVLSH